MFEPIKDNELRTIVPGCILSLPAKCWIPEDKFVDPRLSREIISYKQVLVMVTHVPENLRGSRWVNVVLVCPPVLFNVTRRPEHFWARLSAPFPGSSLVCSHCPTRLEYFALRVCISYDYISTSRTSTCWLLWLV